MSPSRSTFYLTSLVIAFSGFSAQAQRPGGKAKGSDPLPLQGKAIPEVTVYDETGEPASLLQRLKGRHGVIVFGCLT